MTHSAPLRASKKRSLQADRLVLLEQRQVPLKKFGAIGGDPFHSQRLRDYCTAELKSPVSAYATASASIIVSSFQTMMLHAALASLTAW